MTRARLGATVAAVLVGALLTPAPAGAQPGSSSIARKAVTLAVALGVLVLVRLSAAPAIGRATHSRVSTPPQRANGVKRAA